MPVPPHDPVIRAIGPGDAAALARISNMPGVRRGTLRMPFETQAFWEKRIAGSSERNGAWIGAEIDGQLVGHAGLNPLPSPRMRHTGEIGMAVADDQTGRGVGRALLAALIDVADNWLALRRLELDVLTDNDAALRLYRRCGFEIEGTKIGAIFCDGAYRDVHIMARLHG